MKSITPFLMFKKDALEAVKFYTSIFRDSKICSTATFSEREIQQLKRLPEDQRPANVGDIKTVDFEINGQRFIAGNGGSFFEFNHGISMSIACDDQNELDQIWDALAEEGQIEECGWVVDKFGIPWQVVPAQYEQWMQSFDVEKKANVGAAILRMKKLDIEKLQRAFETGELPENENDLDRNQTGWDLVDSEEVRSFH